MQAEEELRIPEVGWKVGISAVLEHFYSYSLGFRIVEYTSFSAVGLNLPHSSVGPQLPRLLCHSHSPACFTQPYVEYWGVLLSCLFSLMLQSDN